MAKPLQIVVWLVLLVGALACDAAPAVPLNPPPGDFGPGPPWLAVVSTDYASSAVSLIDLRQAVVAHAGLLDSGSKMSPGMTTLSGDVVLASSLAEAPTPSTVTVVDRASGVVTVVDLAGRQVTRQLNVATGFYANPYDAVLLGPHWWVSRTGRNAKANDTPDPLDGGDDLLVLDNATGKPTGRLDLQPWSTFATGLAAPQRLVVDGPRLWTALGSFSPDFKQQGPGRLLEVDWQNQTVVQAVELAPWTNCVSVQLLQGEPGQRDLVVACQGAYGGGPAAQLAGSALLRVTVTDPPTVAVLVRASDLGDQPFGTALAVLGNRVLWQSMGRFSPAKSDILWWLDLQANRPPAVLLSSGKAFSLSGLVADPARNMVWLGHRDRTRDLLRWQATTTDFVALPALAVLPGSIRVGELGLP